VTSNRQRAWDRFEGGEGNSLPADFVVALAEQPRSGGRNPVWAATQPSQFEQRFGVAVTKDGGTTFEKTLIGESISDIAARQARVYAVGPEGLYVTADQGTSWRTVDTFPLKNDNQILPDDTTPLTVATTEAALWVGTDEGLLRLDRGEESSLLGSSPGWALFRAETIYDFGMNRVRTITDQKPDGQQETVWRGTNDQGLRVPTGTYFYTVDLGGRTVKGKILVAN